MMARSRPGSLDNRMQSDGPPAFPGSTANTGARRASEARPDMITFDGAHPVVHAIVDRRRHTLGVSMALSVAQPVVSSATNALCEASHNEKESIRAVPESSVR